MPDDNIDTETSSVTPADGDPVVVEMVAKGFQHQFWKAVNQGADQAAQDLNAKITFQGPENETAIQEQVQILSNAINKQPDAICLAALDTTASIDLINQAMNSGIPIVGFDSGVPGAPEGSIVANASTDNIQAAALAAETLFPAIEEKIKTATSDNPVRIGVVSQEVNSASISDRTKGFIDKMVELSSGVEGVEKVAVVGNDKFNNGVSEKDASVILDLAVPAKATDADAQTQAQTLLNKQDIIAIFGTNEFAAKAIINADNAMGNILGEDILGVGFDAGMMQKEAIRAGQLFGSITQDPVQIGYKAVELAVKATRGEAIEDIDTGAKWYNSENVDSEEMAPLLYD